MTEIALIALRGITKQHRENGVVTDALRGVDLTIRKGEFIAIVGSSGAGKSSLLNIIGLLEHPTGGEYRVDGVDLRDVKERGRDLLRARKFGFVFQSSHALPEQSVSRNAALGLEVQGVARADQVQIVSQLLGSLGLLHRASVKAKFLSGGERQRLAIGRAMSTAPDVILADEPTGNLDRENSANVLALLQSLNASGATIVLITHDESVAAVANRRVRMQDGRIVDDTAKTLESHTIPQRLGSPRRPTGWTRRLRALSGTGSDSIASISSHLARSAFLILAFLIGAGGLVTAVGLSQSAAIQVSTRLSDAALDRVTVSLPHGWSADHVASVQRRILRLPGVKNAATQITLTPADLNISHLPTGTSRHQYTFDGLVVGGGSDLIGLNRLNVLPHQSVDLLNDNAPSAILGTEAAKALDIDTIGPGQEIWVAGTRVPVVGIILTGNRGEDAADTIYLSKTFAAGLPQGLSNTIIRTTPGYPAPLADALPLLLAPSNPASISVQTVADLRHLAEGVNADFAVFIGAMSLAILLLASFSAATTMYLSVMGRSAEIALRRAVGATRSQIGLLFLAEGGLLGLAGGAAGAAVGSLTVVFFCSINKWSAELTLSTLALALAVGVATGLLAAILPAVRASRIDPAQAIRG